MPNPSPSEVATALRTKALLEYPARFAQDPRFRDAPVLGAIMEIGYEKAAATLSCSIAGDASIYFSSGGGIIGGVGHAKVKIAARRFTQFAGVHPPEMAQCVDYPLPKVGHTIFYVTTPAGVFTFESPTQKLGEGESEFSPLFHLGNAVISYLRMTVEQKEKPSTASTPKN